MKGFIFFFFALTRLFLTHGGNVFQVITPVSKKAPAHVRKETLPPASFHPKHPNYTAQSVSVSANEDTKHVQKPIENEEIVKAVAEKATKGIKSKSKPNLETPSIWYRSVKTLVKLY